MQPPPQRGHLILIGGSVRAATESAVRDGWSVSAIDLFGDVDTRRSAQSWHPLASPAELVRLIGGLPPGAVIVTGGMEQWYEILDHLRTTRPVLAPPSQDIASLRDPHFLRAIAARSGFEFPPFIDAGPQGLPAGWLVKSRRTAGGLGVATSNSAALGSHDYFQQRVPGRPFGAAFLATDSGTQLLGVTRSLTCSVGRHPFLYAGSIGPVAITPEYRERLLRVADSIRQQVDLRGLFGIDLLLAPRAERLWLLEINPRYTAAMELLESPATPSLITCHALAYRAECPERHETPATIHFKRVAWSRQACRWDPRWHRGAMAGMARVMLRDIPQPGSQIEIGQPIVSIYATGPRMSHCLRAAAEVERRLQRLIGSTAAEPR